MSRIRGYKNNQPVGSFNKMDVENGIYYADPTRSDSDVYGDLRVSRQGRALVGDGVMYITITGLLTTDTITAIAGSDTPTCTIDGRLDIATNDKVFEFYIYRSSVLIGHYILEEETGTTIFQIDKSLLLPDGTIFDSSPSNFITDNSVGVSYANMYGYSKESDYGWLSNYLNVTQGRLETLNDIILSGSSNYDFEFEYKHDTSLSGIVTFGNKNTTFQGIRGNAFQINVTIGGLGINFTHNLDSNVNGYDVIIRLTKRGANHTELTITDRLTHTILYNEISTLSRGGTNTVNALTHFIGYTLLGRIREVKIWKESVLTHYWPLDYSLKDVVGGNDLYITLGSLDNFDSKLIIPRDESNPTKDVLGNDLQYKGKVPYQFHITNSPCFKGVTGSYMTLDVEPTDIITAHGNSAVPTCTISGQLDFVNDSLYYGITITRAGTKIAFLPMTNDPAIGTYYDSGVVGGTPTNNDATLINSSPANQGFQNEFDYLQYGRYDNGSDYVPILEDFSAFADGTALGLGVMNDGTMFINTGETLTLDATPETVQADAANNVYFDALGDPIDQTFASFTTNNLTNNQYFNDVSNTDYIPMIRFHKDNLTTEQVNTDKKLTNN